MTQQELNHAIAQATGESVSEIHRLGFQPGMLEMDDIEDSFVDWDELDLDRNVALIQQRQPLIVV